jgi:Fic family protein
MSYEKIALIKPSFESPMIDDIIALEKLRSQHIDGTTPASIFFQLKKIFHIMESIGSARIEGNRTTLSEYIESKITPATLETREDIQEIANIEIALEFIEKNIGIYPINKIFL